MLLGRFADIRVWLVATRAANALIEDAELPWAGVVIKPVESVLSGFKKAYGGLWVGGRATLTADEFRFRANAANRALHSGTMELAVPLSAVVDVQVLRGLVTRIVAIRTERTVVKIRCFGAAAFADQIRGLQQST